MISDQPTSSYSLLPAGKNLELHILDAKAFRTEPKPLSREIVRLMQRYNWPGNIRQLENLIRGYVLMGDEESLASELVPASQAAGVPEIDLAHPISLKEITKAATRGLERDIILKVLQANGWSRRKTAKWLNISYRSLLYKLQESEVNAIPARGRKKVPEDPTGSQ